MQQLLELKEQFMSKCKEKRWGGGAICLRHYLLRAQSGANFRKIRSLSGTILAQYSPGHTE